MPTHAEQMVTKLEALLLKNPGATQVRIEGGVTITYADLQKRLEYWQKKVALESGTFSRRRTVDMGGAW